jgi:hypothetical protein
MVRWVPSARPSCALDFTALGRSVIADRPPSDGSDEEAEKRGLVHGGIHPPIGYLAVQQHVLLQLNLPGSEIERKPPFDSR